MLFELLLIGIGLSMDAFAVSVCKGLGMDKLNIRQTIIIALYFGTFQGLMPALGWFFGLQLEHFVSKFAHIIAFILLLIIGGKMIIEAIKEDSCCKECTKLSHRELFILAIATSIDALAIGISFAFLNTPIIPAIIIIGLTTFVLSILGVIIGNKFGSKYQQKAEISGGIILILIGLKILIEHYIA